MIDWTFHITVIVAASVIGIVVYRMINHPAQAPLPQPGADGNVLDAGRA